MSFSFEVVTVNIRGEIINRRLSQANYFTENLGNNMTLDMVAIPDGTFFMGSTNTELEHLKYESPQHRVTIAPFYMGKYLVTQAQWQAVAALPKVNHDLKSDPSHFKGANRPVEKVSWYDAVEFCARLSQKTGRNYRLPSEAEWEYACRAGTTTPFYFGETITTDLVKYNGNYTYGSAPEGQFRQQTTEVGSFPPNSFGLYDMHGNVLEWCADTWHEYYQGAPTDGSPWIDNGNHSHRLLRGGAWDLLPGYYCRSACRLISAVGDGYTNNNMGFRVVFE